MTDERPELQGLGSDIDRKCLLSAYTESKTQKARLAGQAKCFPYMVAVARFPQYFWPRSGWPENRLTARRARKGNPGARPGLTGRLDVPPGRYFFFAGRQRSTCSQVL